MSNFFNYAVSFVKKEAVFCAAFILAAVSCFFVKPCAGYFYYIDWNTLALLFSLMTIVAALNSLGIFRFLGNSLCSKITSLRVLCFILIMMCFFFSMILTNDVALLTFVPFAISVLLEAGAGAFTVTFTVVLQTVAANTGSMLTPIGNPQNLFLFGKMNCSIFSFMKIIFPFTAVSFFLLAVCMIFIPKGKCAAPKQKFSNFHHVENSRIYALRFALYIFLFALSLFSVLGFVPKWISAAVTFAVILFSDRKIFLKVDYMLLFTFTAFFIFTGNIQNMDKVKTFLEGIVRNRECISSVAASQVISNVPSALLLYPFSADLEKLLIGVNVGGLGTLVASLASLISFKIHSVNVKKSSGKFFVLFTMVNIAFLACLLFEYSLLY